MLKGTVLVLGGWADAVRLCAGFAVTAGTGRSLEAGTTGTTGIGGWSGTMGTAGTAYRHCGHYGHYGY